MPFASLAAEVIQVIFEHTLDDEPKADPLQPPLLLTQVTKHWRDIALCTPSLWSSFTLGGMTSADYDYNAKPQALREELLRLWLSRSGALPLRLAVHTDTDQKAASMRLLLAHAHRWKTAHLTFSALILVALNEPPEYPLLEQLTLSNAEQSLGAGAEYEISIAESHAPRLRRVILSGFTQGQIHLRWAQLTHLKFTSTWGVRDTSDVLRPCTALQSFDCFWCIPGDVDMSMQPLAPFKALRHLKLTNQNLLHFLTLPVLTHLHLDDLVDMGDDSAEVLVTLISRSRCADRLESLIIDQDLESASQENLHALMRMLTALKHLSLKLDHDIRPGLPLVSTVLADEMCVPSLETLILRAWSKAENELGDLLEALRPRCNSGVLRRFELTLQTRVSLVTPPDSPPYDSYRYDDRPGISEHQETQPDGYEEGFDDTREPPMDPRYYWETSSMSPAEGEAYRQRHRALISPSLVEEFRALANQDSSFELRLVTSRPADGLYGGGKWLKAEDVNVLVDTWESNNGADFCRCSFCVEEERR
ncbi:hypothetical protein C8F01DRAFT_292395 [Mycena amicta]|nr:hypothetical protein C8F01DRAFT_292395 [Mycena amicta]